MHKVSAWLKENDLSRANIADTRSRLQSAGFVFNADLTNSNPYSLHPIMGTHIHIDHNNGRIEQHWSTYD